VTKVKISSISEQKVYKNRSFEDKNIKINILTAAQKNPMKDKNGKNRYNHKNVIEPPTRATFFASIHFRRSNC
jgi:hypothetical protein